MAVAGWRNSLGHPQRASIAPATLHLAAIAGPDTGVLIPVDHVVEIGSELPAAVLRDEALDARHATAVATSAWVLRVKDPAPSTALASGPGKPARFRGAAKDVRRQLASAT